MNGVAIGPNSRKNIEALKKADFLVVCELYPEETAEFWKAPGTTKDDMKKINTTVYRLPGAGFAEKRSEEHTSELQSHHDLVCRLLLEKKKKENRVDREIVRTVESAYLIDRDPYVVAC